MPGIDVYKRQSPCKEAIDMTTAGHLLRAVYAVHNGVYAMSQDLSLIHIFILYLPMVMPKRIVG